MKIEVKKDKRYIYVVINAIVKEVLSNTLGEELAHTLVPC
jgi:hypothetical protein